jgi:citrate lyase subunit beta/citryl-CoA lyase
MKTSSESFIYLYVPGYKPANIEQAIGYHIKNIIFCLEDGTPDDKKMEGRILVANALKIYKNSKKTFIVRINSVDTDYWQQDLSTILPHNPHRIRIPKINSTEELQLIENFIDKLRRKDKSIIAPNYEVMIESYAAYTSMAAIAKFSNKIFAFTVGGEDLSNDLIKHNIQIKMEDMKLMIVARAHQLQYPCLDTTYMDYKNDQGFMKNCYMSKQLGFDGRSLMHPNQIYLALTIYEEKTHV